MNSQRSKKELCFDIQLSIIQCLQFLDFISVFMLTNGLKVKHFLVGVQDLNKIPWPINLLWGDLSVFWCFENTPIYNLIDSNLHLGGTLLLLILILDVRSTTLTLIARILSTCGFSSFNNFIINQLYNKFMSIIQSFISVCFLVLLPE